jgi:hypothetical protein
MTKNPRLTVSKRINLDTELAERITNYRFVRRIASENEAYRDLLKTGHREACGLDLIAKARRCLTIACDLTEGPFEAKEARLPVAKRLNLDKELADQIAAYKDALQLNSENQAYRDLLQLGMDLAEGKRGSDPQRLVAMAKKSIQAAVNNSLKTVLNKTKIVEKSENPGEILRIIADLFNEDGSLKGL